MLTAPQDRERNNSDDENRTPVTSFTRVIEVAPGAGSFSGWGPKVTSSSLITRFN